MKCLQIKFDTFKQHEVSIPFDRIKTLNIYQMECFQIKFDDFQ